MLWESLEVHIRFLHQLHLPSGVLNRITRKNFERLANLEPVPLNPQTCPGVQP